MSSQKYKRKAFVITIITIKRGRDNMLEKVINELLTIRGINIKYDWTFREKAELASFVKGENPRFKQISSLRHWAERLDVTPSFIIEILKYNKMEEIWK